MRIKLCQQEHRPTYPTTYLGSLECIHYEKSPEIYLSHNSKKKFFSSMKMGDVTISVFHPHTNDGFWKSVVDIKSGIVWEESTVIMAMMRNRCLSVSSRKWIYWKRRVWKSGMENGFACVAVFRMASGFVCKFKFITLSVVLVAAAVTRHFLSNRHVQSNSRKKRSLRFGLSTYFRVSRIIRTMFFCRLIFRIRNRIGSCFLFGRIGAVRIKTRCKIYQMSNADHSLFHRPSFD